MGIKFILMVNKQGQTRLAQYYEYLTLEERRTLEGDIPGGGAVARWRWWEKTGTRWRWSEKRDGQRTEAEAVTSRRCGGGSGGGTSRRCGGVDRRWERSQPVGFFCFME
ncbi:hypothetical protein SSX86_008179 [Deinandra increscens subsp. villosa]|uniref:AP complex mu/sigma subunit domain-containing protein n=1 Tax=Deinandra increscens subsp. villosa TaxID=3103831 RepID=A0AAP0D0Z1_9ASTR